MNTTSLMQMQGQIHEAMIHLAAAQQALGEALSPLPFTDIQEPKLIRLTLVTDGGSRGNPGEGYGSYALFEGEGSEPTAIASKVFGQDMTNNEAEYEALLWGLERTHQYQVNWGMIPEIALTIRIDSALVRGQLQEGWKVNAPNLRERIRKARELLTNFASWEIKHIPRVEVEAVLGH